MPRNRSQNGCLFAIFSLFGLGGRPTGGFRGVFPQYRRRDDFLTPAELAFYRALILATREQNAVICPKVRVGDLLFPDRGVGSQTARSRIERKHVDFVICVESTMKPAVVIELDDSSHERPDRRERDEFVDAAFRGAAMPIVHIAVSGRYNPQEIWKAIEPYLVVATAPKPNVPPVVAAAAVRPRCPKCGVEMVERRATRGRQEGEPFYGCLNFPRCREIVPIRRS